MAVQAHLKLVGVVENMSHAVCPDCGKEMRIFGGDGGDRVAEELEQKVLDASRSNPTQAGSRAARSSRRAPTKPASSTR
jgi:ATP-binding protein involved in chromosome partitioning